MVQLSQELIKHIKYTINIASDLQVILVNTTSKELSTLNQHEYNSNIYCIDKDYNIIWQIDSDARLNEKDSLVYIEKTAQGIAAQRFSGIQYLIELGTGKSIRTGWSKS